MNMAPKSGVQPCERRLLTCGFLRTQIMHAVDEMTRRMHKTRGSGVLTKPMRNVDTSPKRQRVMRSPKHAATGGAILSKFMLEGIQ